jgi:hypothetical protein
MRTLQVSVGKVINIIKLNNNPEITLGGYFLISQMLAYIRGLVALDLSSNDLTAAEARVLSLGMRGNKSVQDLKLRDNSIGSEGATSIAAMLRVNRVLMALVCSCVCVCVCICVYVFVCMCCAHVYVYVCVCECCCKIVL